MSLDIDPRLLGSPLLTWTSPSTLVGIAIGLTLMLRWAPGLGLRRRDAYAVGLRVVLWSLLGARLFHVLEFTPFYSEVPFRSFYLWSGGLSLWGALILGSAGALWHVRRRGLPVGRFADRLAVAGLAVVAMGRLGDLLAGERSGSPTSLPWGIEYVNERSAAHVHGVAVHPVALYELLLALVAIAVLVWLGGRRRRSEAAEAPTAGATGAGTPRRRLAAAWAKLVGLPRRLVPDGAAFVLAMAIYATGRFLISFVSVAPEGWGLQAAQWVGLGVLLAAGAYWSRVRPRSVEAPRA